MNRERVLSLIDFSQGRGLEIGALASPIVTRDLGAVEYIDRATREELMSSYGSSELIDADAIVDVDHVWGDQTLLDCVGGKRAYDYLVASHVIEHVPDLYGWLQEIAAVLVDGGHAVFVVPDKRYTFDARRRTSSAAELIDAHLTGRRQPSVRQVFDCFHNFQAPEDGDTPDGDAPGRTEEVLLACRRVADAGEYIDAHCWVFTPRSTLEALDLGNRLGLLPFVIERLEPTDSGQIDFALVLRRLPDDMAPEAARAAFLESLDAIDLPAEAALSEADGLLLAESHHAIARLAAIEQSTSWRVTAPLRALARAMGRG